MHITSLYNLFLRDIMHCYPSLFFTHFLVHNEESLYSCIVASVILMKFITLLNRFALDHLKDVGCSCMGHSLVSSNCECVVPSFLSNTVSS